MGELDLSARAERRASSRPYLALNMISHRRRPRDARRPLGSARRARRLGDASRVAHDRGRGDGGRGNASALSATPGLFASEHDRDIRRARGLAEEPLICVVSGRLALGEEIPLLADPDAHVAIITASEASLPQECRARIEYVRAANDGVLDLPAAMRELRGRLGVRTLLCEGGPHLNSHLLAAGLVDELFLTLSPKLAGGEETSETLRILSGPEPQPPVALELVAALEHDSYLFLRYRIIH